MSYPDDVLTALSVEGKLRQAQRHKRYEQIHGLAGLLWMLTIVGFPLAVVHYWFAWRHAKRRAAIEEVLADGG